MRRPPLHRGHRSPQMQDAPGLLPGCHVLPRELDPGSGPVIAASAECGAGTAISWTGRLKAIQRAMPPSSGRTRVTPRRWSC